MQLRPAEKNLDNTQRTIPEPVLLFGMLTKLVILGIYFAILFLIGVLASRRVKGLSDYYVGGKQVGYWAAAFSARATGESGWLLLGLTGLGALAGVSGYWVVVGELLGVYLSWTYMAKPFKRMTDAYGAITIPDFLEGRFRPKTHLLRSVAATALSVFVVIYVSAQIDTTGKAFESLLGMNYFTGALLGFGIVLSYIFIGGFLAAVWSDLFQGILMFFGLLLLPIAAWMSVESTGAFVEGLRAIDPRLLQPWGTSENPWMNVFTILGFSMIGLGYLGSPQIYVRFISIKNEEEITKGRRVALVFTLITDAAAVSIGLLGRYLFSSVGDDPIAVFGTGAENVLIMMVENLLPLTLVGLYIAIVLSAIMSTIDSLLIVASSAITRDFYQMIFRPDLDGSTMAPIPLRHARHGLVRLGTFVHGCGAQPGPYGVLVRHLRLVRHRGHLLSGHHPRALLETLFRKRCHRVHGHRFPLRALLQVRGAAHGRHRFGL